MFLVLLKTIVMLFIVSLITVLVVCLFFSIMYAILSLLSMLFYGEKI